MESSKIFSMNKLQMLRLQLFVIAVCYEFTHWLSFQFISLTDFAIPFSVVPFFVLIIFSATFFLAEQAKAYSEKILIATYFLVTIHFAGLSAVNNFRLEFLVVLTLLIVFSNLRVEELKLLIVFNSALAILLPIMIFNISPENDSK